MKSFLFIFFVTTQLLFSSATKHNMLPYTQIHSLIKSIDSNAITIGEGKKTVFVFLDPMCKFSRKFIKTVTDNPYMLQKYQYHIFLYEIPRLDSNNIIHYVYQSKAPLRELMKIMLENNKPTIKTTFASQTKETVLRIKKIARKIDVYKRPYIIISEYENGEI